MAKALDGLLVALQESLSWSWDRETATAAERPLYRTVYVLDI